MNTKYLHKNISNEIYHDLKESKIEDILKKYRISKKYSKNKDGYKTIEYSFGMNGKGLTKELCIIAKDVEKETKKPFYLCEAHFDILDDLYSFIVVTQDKYVNEHLSITEIKSYIKDINETICAFNDVRKALNEGAWGYKPYQSDDFLDETHVIADKVMDILIEGLTKDKHHFYTYMGLTIDFLRTRYIASESFFWVDDEEKQKEEKKKSHYKKRYKLIDSFNKAYEELKNSDNFHGWSHFDEFKKELDNTKKIFDKLMAERKMYSSDVDNDKLYELNKKRDKLFYEDE